MRPEMKVIVIINFSEKSLQRKCKYKYVNINFTKKLKLQWQI